MSDHITGVDESNNSLDGVPNPVDVVPFYDDGVYGDGFAVGFDMNSADEVERRRARSTRFTTNLSDFGVHPTNHMDNTQSRPQSLALGLGNTEADSAAILSRQERFAGSIGSGKINQLTMSTSSSNEMSDSGDLSSLLDDTVARNLPDIDLQQEIEAFDPRLTRRWDAIHLVGPAMLTLNMDSRNILSRFEGYGAVAVEWISDYRCNVTFVDSHSCKRALQYFSTHRAVDVFRASSYITSTETEVNFAEDDLEFVVWRSIVPERWGIVETRGGRARRQERRAPRIDLSKQSVAVRVATSHDIKRPYTDRSESVFYSKNIDAFLALRARRKAARAAAVMDEDTAAGDNQAHNYHPTTETGEQVSDVVTTVSLTDTHTDGDNNDSNLRVIIDNGAGARMFANTLVAATRADAASGSIRPADLSSAYTTFAKGLSGSIEESEKKISIVSQQFMTETGVACTGRGFSESVGEVLPSGAFDNHRQGRGRVQVIRRSSPERRGSSYRDESPSRRRGGRDYGRERDRGRDYDRSTRGRNRSRERNYSHSPSRSRSPYGISRSAWKSQKPKSHRRDEEPSYTSYDRNSEDAQNRPRLLGLPSSSMRDSGRPLEKFVPLVPIETGTSKMFALEMERKARAAEADEQANALHQIPVDNGNNIDISNSQENTTPHTSYGMDSNNTTAKASSLPTQPQQEAHQYNSYENMEQHGDQDSYQDIYIYEE